MKQFSFIISIITSFIFFTACNGSKLDGKEYIQYVEDEGNGLLNIKKIGELTYQLQYCPQEYLILNEFKTYHVSQKTIDLKKQDSDSLLYFKLRIKNKTGDGDILNHGISSKEENYERIEYLSYGFEENVALINTKDTIYPALFHFERTYGVAPFADFLMAFNAKRFLSEDISVIINDRVFGNGLIKFTFRKEDIDKLPILNTN